MVTIIKLNILISVTDRQTEGRFTFQRVTTYEFESQIPSFEFWFLRLETRNSIKETIDAKDMDLLRQ